MGDLGRGTDYEHSNRMAWPVHRPPDLTVMPAMVPHPSADWAAHQGERAESIRAKRKRLSDHYENLTKQQEDRVNAEERDRAAAMGRR